MNVITEQKTKTNPETGEELTYNVTNEVPEQREKIVNYTVCKMVPQQKTKTIEYQTTRMETIELPRQ